jgi:hypothetical protein
MIGLTTDELAAATRVHPEFLTSLLEDERRRGHVERVGGDRWAVTAAFDQRHGRVFRNIHTEGEEQR